MITKRMKNKKDILAIIDKYKAKIEKYSDIKYV